VPPSSHLEHGTLPPATDDAMTALAIALTLEVHRDEAEQEERSKWDGGGATGAWWAPDGAHAATKLMSWH
jgi:hypothetical protein